MYSSSVLYFGLFGLNCITCAPYAIATSAARREQRNKMALTSDQDDYKVSKEAFVSGLTGSTVSHVNMISFVALVCSLFSLYDLHCLPRNLRQASIALHSAIRSRFPVPIFFRFLFEWLLLVVPVLLSMTLFADRPGTLSVGLLLPTAFIYFFFPPRESGTPLPSAGTASPRASSSPHLTPGSYHDETSRQHSASSEQPEMTRLSALSTYRAHMMLLTVLAILAVDFSVFPRTLAKCETYGVSFVRFLLVLATFLWYSKLRASVDGHGRRRVCIFPRNCLCDPSHPVYHIPGGFKTAALAPDCDCSQKSPSCIGAWLGSRRASERCAIPGALSMFSPISS